MPRSVDNYFDEFQGVLWVQPDGPNTEPVPIVCATVDAVDQPLGDVTRRYCRTGSGGQVTVKISQGTPGAVTFDIVLWKSNIRNALQKAAAKRVRGQVCPIGVYIHHGVCGRLDVFLNYATTQVFQDAILTTKGTGNNARGQQESNDTPEMVSQTFSIDADPDSPELYSALLNTTTACAAEAEPFRALAICSEARCNIGVCGAPADRCDEIHVVADATGAAVADGYVSTNGMSSCAAWTAQPFAVGEDIAALRCFIVNGTDERLIAARGTTDAGNPAEIAWSDDGGVTWNNVNVGAINGEYALHSQALFILDYRNIWLGTDLGNVYFSDDAGLTWTDQNAPVPGAGEGLYAIHGVDENYLWGVGGDRVAPTGYYIQTTDGGEHWNLATAEPAVEVGNWVQVLDGQRLWVGLDDGRVFYSLNWGTTWVQRVLPVALTNSGAGLFINPYIGAIGGYKAGVGNGVPTILRTFNGGFDWEEFNLVDEFGAAVEYYGVNDLAACDENHWIAAVEADATASRVWQLMPAGWTA